MGRPAALAGRPGEALTGVSSRSEAGLHEVAGRPAERTQNRLFPDSKQNARKGTCEDSRGVLRIPASRRTRDEDDPEPRKPGRFDEFVSTPNAHQVGECFRGPGHLSAKLPTGTTGIGSKKPRLATGPRADLTEGRPRLVGASHFALLSPRWGRGLLWSAALWTCKRPRLEIAHGRGPPPRKAAGLLDLNEHQEGRGNRAWNWAKAGAGAFGDKGFTGGSPKPRKTVDANPTAGALSGRILPGP